MNKQICYIWWLPWVWKTTLGEELEKFWNSIHIDTDVLLNDLVSDSERFLKYLFNSIPKEISNEIKKSKDPISLFQEIFKQWWFELSRGTRNCWKN